MPRSRPPQTAVVPAASTRAHAESVAVSVSAIAGRAFDLYLARGRQDGRDIDDWLQAERELQGEKGQLQGERQVQRNRRRPSVQSERRS